MVVEVGNGVSLAADLVSGAAEQITTMTKHSFNYHGRVTIDLEALRAAGNDTSLMTNGSQATATRANVHSETTNFVSAI